MKTFFFFIAILLLSSISNAITSPYTNTDIVDALIQDYMVEHNVPGLSISIQKNGKIYYSRGYGFADKSEKTNALYTTPYLSASITKTFTSLAVLKLWQDGKLSLDDPINDFLSGKKITSVHGSPDQITIKRLLNHTSGLPVHFRFFFDGSGLTPESYDETLSYFGQTVFTPGETFEYSNLGFGLLEKPIEQVSEKSYEEFVHQAIIEPLNLKNTFFLTEHNNALVAVKYDQAGQAVPAVRSHHAGAALLYSSTYDLAKLGQELNRAFSGKSKIFSLELAQEIISEPISLSPYEAQYGLGVVMRKINDISLYSHSGGMAGTSTNLQFSPEIGFSLAIALNKSNHDHYDLLDNIVHLIEPRLSKKVIAPEIPKRFSGQWRAIFGAEFKLENQLSFGATDEGFSAFFLNGQRLHLQSVAEIRDGFYEFKFFNGALNFDHINSDHHRLTMKIKRQNKTAYGYIFTEPRPVLGGEIDGLAYPIKFQLIESGQAE